MTQRKHGHYFKDVSHLKDIDVYRVLGLFGVTDQAIGHAVKKLLVAGGRGAGKDIGRDIQEAIDTLERWKELKQEDSCKVDDMLPETTQPGVYDADFTPLSYTPEIEVLFPPDTIRNIFMSNCGYTDSGTYEVNIGQATAITKEILRVFGGHK